MGFIFGIFKFFRLPIQMAVGLYLAFLMLIASAAGIAYFAEGINYCNEFKFMIKIRIIASILETLMNERHST